MNMQDETQRGASGSGSAEQTGRDRSEQQQNTNLSAADKQRMASGIGEETSKVSSINELGGNSGRDDLAGGSNDGMESQNTGGATDKS